MIFLVQVDLFIYIWERKNVQDLYFLISSHAFHFSKGLGGCSNQSAIAMAIATQDSTPLGTRLHHFGVVLLVVTVHCMVSVLYSICTDFTLCCVL